MLFPFESKLLLLRSLCDRYGLPYEMSHVICSYVFTSYDDAVDRVRSRIEDIGNILKSAMSRKNGFGGHDENDSEDEHWIFGVSEYIMHSNVEIRTSVVQFQALNCRRCGEYIYAIYASYSLCPLPCNIVCCCDNE
jgi:hypothetical protein